MTFREINFGPYANNILDFIDRTDLVTPKGSPTRITRPGMDFVILINGLPVVSTIDNVEASYVLNYYQIGVSHE